MRSVLTFPAGIALLLALGLGALAWQQRANAALERELADRRQLAAEQTQLRAEHRRLQSAQLAAAALAEQREARAALTGLAAELATVRRRVGGASMKSTLTDQPDARHLSLRDGDVSASEWSEAGDGDPVSTLGTALRAAFRGDVEKLAGMLAMTDVTRDLAAATYARLPPAARSEVASPEQLVALLTATATPLGSAHVITQFNDAPDTARLAVQMTDDTGKSRELLLTVKARDNHWRLFVPDTALNGYLAALQKPAGP